MLRSVSCIVTLAGACLLSPTARGDQWGAPASEHRSRSGRHVLHVSWGLFAPDRLSLWTEGEQRKAKVWSRGYVDPQSPPHMAYITDDGQHVVLRDVYHRLGYGKCLVFLGPQGEEIKSYELEEFLTQEEILNCMISVSSRWWSIPGWFRLRDEDRQFAFITARGSIRCFDVATGDRLPLDDRLRSAIVSEAVPELREQLDEGEARQRAEAATLLGFVGGKECIPELIEAMHSGGVTHELVAGERLSLLNVASGRVKPEQIDGVRLASAAALVELMGAEALPLIAPELEKTRGMRRTELLKVMAKESFLSPNEPALSRWPVAREVWLRLAEHREADVRDAALRQLVRSDDGQFLLAHLELLDSSDAEVRDTAVGVLCKTATRAQVPLLLNLVETAKDHRRLWVLRSLIRIGPAELRGVLEAAMSGSDAAMRFEAMLELARRGDVSATDMLLKRIESWKLHTHEQNGRPCGLRDARSVCKVIFEANLTQAVALLHEVAAVDCEEIQVPISGVLAGFGDESALERLRRLSRDAGWSNRDEALRWLGKVGDVDSLAILRIAADEEEPSIRDAAQEAMSMLARRTSSRPASTPAATAPAD